MKKLYLSLLILALVVSPILVGSSVWGGSSGSSPSIGGTVTAGTTGSVLFVGPGPVLSQDNSNFFWDDTNNRLGLGTTAPSYSLGLNASGATALYSHYTNGTTGTASTDGLLIGLHTDGIARIRQQENLGLEFYTNNTLRLTIDSSGNSAFTGAVGVNAATPNHELDIRDTAAAAVAAQLTNSTTGHASTDGIKISVDAAGAANIENQEATLLTIYSGGNITQNAAGGSFGIQTGGTTRQSTSGAHTYWSTPLNGNGQKIGFTNSGSVAAPFDETFVKAVLLAYEDGDADPAAAAGTIKVETGTNLTLDADEVVGSSAAPPLSGFKQKQVASTTTTITEVQCGSTFVSDSADTLTLPEASTVQGCRLTFVCGTTDNFLIDPNDGTDQIGPLTYVTSAGAAGALAPSAGDRIQCAVIGASVTIEAVGSNLWAVIGAANGEWTDQN